MNFIYNNRTGNLRWLPIGIFVLTLLFVAEVEVYGQADIVAAASESVLVYPIAVAVNKSVVLRLPKRATRVSVTQPEIAEAVVVTPDQILINGKAVGSTSLVVVVRRAQNQQIVRRECFDSTRQFCLLFSRCSSVAAHN